MWLINNENRHNIELPPLMGMSRQRKDGWAGRIRTYACWDQNPVPYRLATAQQERRILAKLVATVKL